MVKRMRHNARRLLTARYDQLEGCYLRHRQAAETLIRDADRFTPITRACFAAGQAALEAAWADGVILWDEHVFLLQDYTVIVAHSVDDFSGRDADFCVRISPPLAIMDADHIAAYLADARRARVDAASHRTELLACYEQARSIYRLSASPYRFTASATVHWAHSHRGLSRNTARRLVVYFQAMYMLFEQMELGLQEIADYLQRHLTGDSSDGPNSLV